MIEVVAVPAPMAAFAQVHLNGLRRRLAEVEIWSDGPVKDVARRAVREEIARVGREMVEHEWRFGLSPSSRPLRV